MQKSRIVEATVEWITLTLRDIRVDRLQGSELEGVANAIRRYISSRPNATETVEGVARWWLLRQRYEDSVEIVQEALNYLESEGKVTKLKVPGGKVVYCSARANRTDESAVHWKY